MNKLSITIRYNTLFGQKMSDFMAGLDLGIEEIEPEPFYKIWLRKHTGLQPVG